MERLDETIQTVKYIANQQYVTSNEVSSAINDLAISAEEIEEVAKII